MLLPADMFRAWFILICLAGENDGRINSAVEAAFALRVSESKAKAVVAFLGGKGLFDPVDGGYFEPHNWKRRQYKSDVSTDRVKEFRERKRNVEVNGNETFQKRPQNQKTEPEVEKAEPSRRRKPKAALPSDFRLSEQDIEFAMSKGWSATYLQSEFSRFCDHASASARQQADWHAAWRNWVTSPYQTNGKSNGNGKHHHGSLSEQAERLADLVRARECEGGAERAPDFFGCDQAGRPDVEILPPERR